MNDILNAVMKSQTLRSDCAATSVLGGVQNDKESLNNPLRLFICRSCAANPNGEDERHRGTPLAVTVQFKTTRWDSSNNQMFDTPSLKESKIGCVSTIDDARAKTSVFSLSWEWAKGEEGKAFSHHARRTEFARLGKVTINIPFLLFRGNETSSCARKLCCREQIRQSLSQ